MRVLLLRAEEQLKETLRKFRKEGFDAYGVPFVQIKPLPFTVPDHDYAVVTSQNAAKLIVERGIELGKVVAIGRKTAEVLERAGFEVLTPSRFDSETLVNEFGEMLRGKRVVAIRSNAGSVVLRRLSEISRFVEVRAYEILPLRGERQIRAVQSAANGFFDATVLSSSMIARNFLDLSVEMGYNAMKTWFVAIGPPTARVVRSFGYEPLMPKEWTFESIIELLKKLDGRT